MANGAANPSWRLLGIRGQRAWSRIKSTAAEQRQLWREVGEALLYGRRLYKADRAFSSWCAEQGFGDMDRQDRADAMWLAESWSLVTDGPTPTDLSHPNRIRRWHREAQAALPPSPDLALSAAIKLPPVETVAPIASKVNKLVAMAEAGAGQESETAKKYLKKQADRLGLFPLIGTTMNTNVSLLRPAAPSYTPVGPFSPSAAPLSMTSQEIAELTGKEHFHVRRDIRAMLEELAKDASSFGDISKDSYGRPLEVFRLPKDLTLTLVSGYSVQMRHRIVTRWLELEAAPAAAPALPKSFAEALRLAAAQHEQLEAQSVEIKQLSHTVETIAPKAAVFDEVVADKGLSKAPRGPRGASTALGWWGSSQRRRKCILAPSMASRASEAVSRPDRPSRKT